MIFRRWLRTVSQEPAKSRNVRWKGTFFLVFCGRCMETLRSPFTGQEYWNGTCLIIRQWERCGACGERNRIARGYQGSVQTEEELEQWLASFSGSSPDSFSPEYG